MKQTSKRFISMILGLVLIVGALIVYFDFIQPVYGEVQNLKSKQFGQENFLNSEKNAINKIQELINTYQGQSEVRQAVSLALPEQEDVVGALVQLYGLVQSSGLSLQSVSVSASGSAGSRPGGQTSSGNQFVRPIGVSTFQVKLAGSYEDLKTFIARLETNIRIFDLKSLVIRPVAVSNGKQTQASYSYDLSVTTYYQGQ